MEELQSQALNIPALHNIRRKEMDSSHSEQILTNSPTPSSSGRSSPNSLVHADNIDGRNTPPPIILGDLISQPIGQEYFRKFLVKTMCVESLDFYLVIERYKLIDSCEERRHLANEICEQFIKSDSPQEVNISSYTREKILTYIKTEDPKSKKKRRSLELDNRLERILASETVYKRKNSAAENHSVTVEIVDGVPVVLDPNAPEAFPKKTLFDEAGESVYELLAEDALPRFQKSDLYEHMNEQLEQKKNKRKYFSSLRGTQSPRSTLSLSKLTLKERKNRPSAPGALAENLSFFNDLKAKFMAKATNKEETEFESQAAMIQTLRLQ